MKAIILFLTIGLFAREQAQSQYITFYMDMNHYLAVSANQLARVAAEQSLTGQASEISAHTDAENTTISQFLLARQLVFKTLTEVDEAIKDGLQVRRQLSLVNDILEELLQIEALAAESPDLLLFARQAGLRVKEQALELYGEVERFYTKGGIAGMMDYNTRDELLGQLTRRLQLLRGTLFGLYRSLYWTKLNGSWKTLHPFSRWVNQDRVLIENILVKVKTLSP